MRKQTKLVAVLSAAALLAIGASMTSFAAKGWTQEDGQWYYYDNSGDYVTDSWKKSGNNYFYLGDEGYMLTNSLIQDGDNYYYVDANGAMVKNQWVQIEADDAEEQDVEYRWYRFGSTGRALRSTSGMTKKTVNGKKYAFDTEGKMLFGFVTEDGEMTNQDTDPVLYADYYFGSNEDGAMYTGWLNYTEGVDEERYDGKDSIWFYYNPTTGEKVKADAGEDFKSKKVGKYYYQFDDMGAMESGWQKSTDTRATDNKYFSDSSEGWLQKNSWVWAVPSEAMAELVESTDYDDDTYRWFYVDSKGETVTNDTKRINSKYYVFDEIGRMKSGLVLLQSNDKVQGNRFADTVDTDVVTGDDIITNNDGVDYSHLFYFGDNEETDGAMKTGANFRIELADDVYTFSFDKTGVASQGKSSNKKLYINGILMSAGDMRYQAVSYNGDVYVTGSTGTVVNAKQNVKDADDNYYAVQKTTEDVYFVEASDNASKIARFIAANDDDATLKLVDDDHEYTLAEVTSSAFMTANDVHLLAAGTNGVIDVQ